MPNLTSAAEISLISPAKLQRRVMHSVIVAIAVSCAIYSSGAFAAPAQPADAKMRLEVPKCPEPTKIGKRDYRDRSTSQQVWSIEDNKINHVDPASQRLQEGDLSHRVIADIAWTLDRYPNHYVALELLVKYSLAGGKIYEFAHPDCYMQWAEDFAPDDTKVLLAQGFYYWRTNRFANAIRSYDKAIDLEPSLASAHYNLGLLQFEMKQYDKAAQEAALAYEYGMTLPGLKTKLTQAGIKIPPAPAIVSSPPEKADESK